MTWKIAKVEKTKTKTTYNDGDNIIVTLFNDAGLGDDEYKVYTWAVDGSKSPTENKNMIKTEIAAHLIRLNKAVDKHDLTDIYYPK